MADDIKNARELYHSLITIDQAPVPKMGQVWLESFCKNLIQILDVDIAIIGTFNDDLTRVTSFCSVVGHKRIPNFEYDLTGTPCEHTLNQDGYYCANHVQEKYPDDADLVEMRAVGYVGASLFDTDRKPLGLISLLSRNPLKDANTYLGILKLASSRVAAELLQTLQQEKLEAYKSDLELVLESSHTAYVKHNFKRNMFSVSSQFWTLLGRRETRTEVSTEEMRSLVHPDDRAELRTVQETRIADRDGFSMDFRLRDKDERFVWVQYRGVAQYDSDNNPVLSTGIMTDITQQKESEEHLERINQRYELAVNATGVGLWEVDMTTQERFTSDRLREILTLDKNTDPKLQNLLDRVHPEDKDLVIAANTELRQSKRSSNVEYRLQRDDGEYIWVRNRARTQLNSDGHLVRVAGIIEDIGERKKQELELEEKNRALEIQNQKLQEVNEQLANAHRARLESESRFERAVQASGGYIFESDTKGAYTYLSNQFEEITGYPPEKLLGGFISSIVPVSERKQVKEQLLALNKGQMSSPELEIPILHKNGHVIWISITAAPYYDAEGRFVGYCGAGNDFTQRKIRDIELADARQKADDANRAKSNFLAAMSHEIRTPMNGVLGMAYSLQNTPIDDDQQDLVSTIIESGEVLLNLLNDILDLSKIEANQLELESTHLDLHSILKKCKQLWTPIFAEKHIELLIDTQIDQTLSLMGDPTRLYQILQNLLSNALKFTSEGTVTLRVALEQDTGDTAVFRIEVKDTGIGIPLDAQDRLFERFTQADSSVARKYGGSGLGLSICRELVALMGGVMGVHSEPGHGSSFWFTAQFKKAKLVRPIETDSTAQNESPSQIQFDASTKILVAEDNAVNQKVISAFLKIAGLSGDLVDNGLKAIEKAQEQDYDLVLMDIQMPELDGMTAAYKMRQLSDHYAAAPIIALTANASLDDQNYYLNSGMSDYVAKPINPEHLFQILDKYIPRAKPDASTPASNEPEKKHAG